MENEKEMLNLSALLRKTIEQFNDDEIDYGQFCNTIYLVADILELKGNKQS